MKGKALNKLQEEIANWMHENNLCQCPASAQAQTSSMPEDRSHLCVAQERSADLANRLQVQDLVKI